MQTKEERKAYHAAWRARNRERWNQYSQEWYAKNPRKRAISNKAWEGRNIERRKAYMQKWRDENKERSAHNQRVLLLGYKTKVVEAYGGKCACCGQKEISFLTVEHINRNGMEHRRVVGNFYKYLVVNNFPKDGITILCMNCNWAERNGRHCPHKLERAPNDPSRPREIDPPIKGQS